MARRDHRVPATPQQAATAASAATRSSLPQTGRSASAPVTAAPVVAGDHSTPKTTIWARFSSRFRSDPTLPLLWLWVFLASISPLFDTDFYWHLRTGQLILELGWIPQVDWFTYTDSERPWIDLHWGFQVLIALLYRIGGVPLITIFKAVVYATTIAVATSVTRRGVDPVPRHDIVPDPAGNSNASPLPDWLLALAWIPSVICLSGRALERPEMLSLLFLAVTLWIVRTSERDGSKSWWLVLLTVVWVNCHALFVLGFVVWGVSLLDRLIRSLAHGRGGLTPLPAESDPRSWAMATVFGGLIAFCNPYFQDGVLFPIELYRKFSIDAPFYAERIGEFNPPWMFIQKFGFVNLYLNAEILLAVLAVGSSLLLLFQRRWSPERWLLLLGFGHLAWKASRNTAPFAIIAGYVLAENLRELWPRFQVCRSWLTRSAWARRTVTGLLCGWSLLVVAGVWNQFGEKNKPFALGEAGDWFMHGPALFAGRPGMPDIAFIAHMGQASVYEFHNGPRRLVFMDPRLEVVSQRTFEEYEAVLAEMTAGNPNWTNRVRGPSGELPAVLFDSRYTRPAINGLLQSPDWRLVFADPSGCVFLPIPVADRLRLPAVSPAPMLRAEK